MSAIKRQEVIGSCRLLLGDCRQILNELPPVEALLTDPPYGISYASKQSQHDKILNDDELACLQFATRIPVRHSAYVFCRWDCIRHLRPPKSLVTWVKNNHTAGDCKHTHGRKTEVALFYPGQHHYFPSGRPTDVINRRKTANKLHPTEKPVDLMTGFLAWSAGTVTDPFMGSGSTLVAAQRLGRTAIGIELDPKHFDTACKRLEDDLKQGRLF